MQICANWKIHLTRQIREWVAENSGRILKFCVILAILIVGSILQLSVWSQVNGISWPVLQEEQWSASIALEQWHRLISDESCKCVMSHYDIKKTLNSSRKARILHQTWKSSCMPNVKKSSIQSWTRVLKQNKNFKYVFWDDTAISCWIRSLPMVYANTEKEDFYKRIEQAYAVLFEHVHQGWGGVKRADF